MTEKDKLIEDHEYDGIKELNNPLPGWWLMTFYITIIFAVIYFAYYQFLGGPTLDEELAQDMSEIQAARTEAEKAVGMKSEENFTSMLDDQEVLAQGKAEFATKCAACHGDKGQGIIGPNLTDDYWIHGDGSIVSILKTANEGVLDKGMPPWKGVIAPDLLEKVAVYVYSLRDTNPEGAKPPQGIQVGKK
ncbi:MAG TPA: cbb3-type cytochrome c oxidase N-terminal domain-containing protein [Thermodesulfobacteriota bacterium]|nr:cbb3-type cytochrome c oxidase N-terminal domain-containing protein [Thermodesulfobacteriota bacterium]